MHRFDKRELTSCDRFVFESRQCVRFQEVDAAGVVFFARFFEYAHLAYEQWLRQLGLPLDRVLEAKSWAAPLRHVECDYLAPARFGDELLVFLVQGLTEDSEISLGWVVRRANTGSSSPGDALPLAVLQTVHTFVDPSTFRRVGVPPEIARALSSSSPSPDGA